jgi:hypothetical protein
MTLSSALQVFQYGTDSEPVLFLKTIASKMLFLFFRIHIMSKLQCVCVCVCYCVYKCGGGVLSVYAPQNNQIFKNYCMSKFQYKIRGKIRAKTTTEGGGGIHNS